MTILLGFLLFVIIGVHADVQTPPQKDVAAIRSIEESFRAAWLKNDEQTIMSLFWADAALYPGGGKPVKGAAALQKYWFGPSDTVTTIDRFDLEIETVEGTDTFAAVTGSDVIHWSTTKKDGSGRKSFVSKGPFVALYLKKNGQWRIHKRFAASKTEEITTGDKK